MKRKASAQWKGSIQEGAGTMTGPSGVLDKTPYSFKTRFKNDDGKAGTNPEELIAASHAGCFSMALSLMLGEAGFTADEINTEATLTMEKDDSGFTITGINLKLEGKIPEISEEEFQELAKKAKEGCPVSKALSAIDITLDATLA